MFEDAESYQNVKEANLSFREIVLLHFRRITQLSCVEFRGGYFTSKQRISGKISYEERVYIPSTTESYCNAVDMFHDLILPLFDKKMKEAIKKIDEDYKSYLEKEKDSKKSLDKLKIKRRLFQQLSLLLKRLRYLEGKQLEDKA